MSTNDFSDAADESESLSAKRLWLIERSGDFNYGLETKLLQ